MKTLIRVIAFGIFSLTSSQLFIVHGQTTASSLLTQISQAFVTNSVVSTIQLTATANWYAGSFEDSGSATLTASANGASQIQLNLAKKGIWTEAQGQIDPSMSCSWADSSAARHVLSGSSCVKPTVWFLPALTLQPSSTLSSITATDLGMSPVGNSTYRHARLQFPSSAMDPAAVGVAQNSSIDIGVDPTSFLPQVVAYTVPPDDGSPVLIPIEIHFSDYRTIQDAQIPFRIQRYVNGTLQLDLTVEAAQIS